MTYCIESLYPKYGILISFITIRQILLIYLLYLGGNGGKTWKIKS